MQRNTYYVWRCRLNGGKIPFFFFFKKIISGDLWTWGLSVFLSESLILSVVYVHPRLSSIFQLLPFVVLFQLLRRKIQVEKAAGVTTEGKYTQI